MAKKPAQKPRGRPKGSSNKPSKSTKFTKSIPTKLDKIMESLQTLAFKGKIKSFSKQKHLVNTLKEYTFISFKIPKTEVKK